MHIFYGIGHQIFSKYFLDRVASHLQEKVSSTDGLSDDHMVHGLVAGLDKTTITMNCYVAMSRSPGSLRADVFLRSVCRLNDQ